MRSKFAVISMIVLLFGPLIVAQDSLDARREQAAKALPRDQPKLYVSIAEAQLKVVNDLYNNADSEQGQAAVKQLAVDCENASNASIASRKNMKHTEIGLRKIGEKLEDIRKNATFDDRAPIKEVIDRIEKGRSSLLDAMFAK